MFARIAGALIRAVLAALVVVIPALVLPGHLVNNPQMIVLVAIIAALLTFVEYSAQSPSIVEFRDAPPFNRLRFVSLFATVFLLSVICSGSVEPTPLTAAVASAGLFVGDAVDFPLSPVWLVTVILPQTAQPELVETVRMAAGMAFLVSLTTLATFILAVRLLGWPGRTCVFNVWVNLPLFDPNSGCDVLDQLKQNARFNIGLGLMLLFLIPPVANMASFLVDPITLDNPQTLIWTLTAWAFLPASTIMRGLALGRIAEMIEEKRRRTHVAREKAILQPV